MDYLNTLQGFLKKNRDEVKEENSSNENVLSSERRDPVFDNVITIPRQVNRVYPETRSQMLYDQLLQELLQSQLLHQLPDHDTLRTIHESLNIHSTPPFARMYTGNERIDYSHLCQLKSSLKNNHGLEDELVDNYLSRDSFLRMKRDQFGRISIHDFFFKYVLRRFFLFENLVDLVGMNLEEESEEEILPDNELDSILRSGGKSRSGKRMLYNNFEYISLEDFRSFLVDAVLQFGFVGNMNKDMINLYVLVCERKFLFHLPQKAIKIQYIKRKKGVVRISNLNLNHTEITEEENEGEKEGEEEEEYEHVPLVLLSLKHLVGLPCLSQFREVGADRDINNKDDDDGEDEEDVSPEKRGRGKNKKKVKASEDINNWFSRKSFLSLRDAFRDMDNENRWSLNRNQFKLFNNGSMSDFAVDRIFELYCHTETSNSDHNSSSLLSIHDFNQHVFMDLSEDHHHGSTLIPNILHQSSSSRRGDGEKRMRIEEFIDFILSYENVFEPKSVSYFWRVVDLKGEGYVDTNDISYIFGQLYDSIVEEYGVTPKLSDIINELMDMALSPYEQTRSKCRIRKKSVMKVGSEWMLKLLDRKVFNSHNPYREEQEEEGDEDEGETLKMLKSSPEREKNEDGSTSPPQISPKKRINRVLKEKM